MRGTPGALEVRLADLPHEAQRRWQAAQVRVAQDRGAPDLWLRLGHLSEELKAAYVMEIGRLIELLHRYENAWPKTVAGGRAPSPVVVELLAAWATTNRLILDHRPSWGGKPTDKTLRNKLRAYRTHGPIALIPGRSHVQRADDRRLKPIPLETQQLIRELYLHELRNAGFALIYDELRKRLPPGEYAPSLSTMKRFIRRNISRAASVIARKGKRTADATILTPIHRTKADLDTCDVWCGDHHQLDIMCVDPADGELKRPWVTMWLDLASRAPVGWVLSFQPNSRTILAALVHGLKPKRHSIFAHLWGKPRWLYIDNGKDYRSKFLERRDGDFGSVLRSGVFAALGIDVTHARPYNAKAKDVERFFGTAVERFSRGQLAYCGRSPADRTERFREMEARYRQWRDGKRPRYELEFPTFAEVIEQFDAFVIEYLKRNHRGLTEHDTGRELAPANVAAARKSEPRAIDEITLAFICMPMVERKVQKGQVSLFGHYYGDFDGEDQLHRYEEEYVECRYDERDIGSVIIVHPKTGKVICKATNAEIIRLAPDGKPTLELKAAIERQRRERARRHAEVARDRLDGRTDEERALEMITPAPPRPTTPASNAAAAPAGIGVIELVPQFDRLAREAAQLKDAEPTQPVPAVITPLPAVMVGGVTIQDTFQAAYGARPQHPGRFAEPHLVESYERLSTFWADAYREHYGKEPPTE